MEQQATETEQEQNVESKGGSGLGLLALLVGLAAAGGSYYVYQQQQQALSALQERYQSLQQSLEALPNSIQEAQQYTLQRIENLPKPLALESIEASIQKGLQQSESALRGEFEQALLDYARGDVPRVDLSQEIAQMDEIRAANQAIHHSNQQLTQNFQNQLAQVESYFQQQQQQFQNHATKMMNEVGNHIQQELQKLDSEIQQRIDPEPTLQWLALADLSARNGRFNAAVRYAQSAEESASRFLNQQELQAELKALTQQYQQLAQQTQPEQVLQSILNGVPQWTFRSLEAQSASAAEDSSWWGDVKRFVARSSSIQVIESDDRALSWLNKHQDLQEILRQNVRLDLSFARNAVQLGDWDGYRIVAERLQQEIPRYFDANHAAVAQALHLLQHLQASAVPNVQALQQRLQSLR